MSQSWLPRAELNGLIRENATLRIDILVESKGCPPIVIENELLPAHEVELDATARLGLTLDSDGSQINQVIALRSARSLRDCDTIEEVLDILHTQKFEWALLAREDSAADDALDKDGQHRVPQLEGQYLKGSIMSFANFIRNVSFSTYKLRQSINELDLGVRDSIGILQSIALTNKRLKAQLANLLMQAFSDTDIKQGLGIAVTVAINATLFQQQLAPKYPQILTMAQMQDQNKLNQTGLIEQWQKILEISYWPIYSIAISVLEAIEDPWIASRFIQRVFQTTQNLIDLGIVDTHDLCGAVFQRFMTERKYLASFYTKPESATLLAHLAVSDLAWHDPDVYRNFKFADLACGTGTLVHSVYRRIAQLHEFSGRDPQQSHAHMMENCITAADIVPSAAHLTATLLSSLFPGETYGTSRVVIPNYGLVEDGQRVCLGSLELLDEENVFGTLFPNPHSSKVVGPTGSSEVSFQLEIPSRSQDLVIMNPPYTRVMSDWINDAHGTWKPFNVLGNTRTTQRLMADREKELTSKMSCYNGYQSMPSAFCGVADLLLKENGIFAFVLPLTALQGVSWRKFRAMLAKSYTNVMVVTIAAAKASDCAWSADTALAEVLVVARKSKVSSDREQRGVLVSLHHRPPNTMLASEYAREIKTSFADGQLRSVEDGPWGATPLEIGGQIVGHLLSVPMSEESWSTLGIRDLSLAQSAYQLASGKLWLPRSRAPVKVEIPMRAIGRFATVGFADNNIANNSVAAFNRVALSTNPDYPMVWKNSSHDQRRMMLEPDQEGLVKPAKESLALRIWERRSKALIAREVSFQSQSLIAGSVEQPVIGGRGWPTVKLNNAAEEKAFVLWGNSTLGILNFWYFSSRQQVRRSIVTVRSINDMPWLDPTQLSREQLAIAEDIFNEFKNSPFLAVGQAVADPARKALDRRILIDLLGMPKSVLAGVDRLRRKWCSEPAVQNN